MKQLLRHPLFIAIISISYLIVGLSMFEQSKSEVEIRGAYEELKEISNELATSDEPGKIKKVIAAFASDIVEGFRAGFNQNSEEDLREYLSIRDKVKISNIAKGISSWKHKEKIIGIIKNDSDSHISSIKLNLTSYSSDSRMIDSETKWLSDIKILAPGDEVSFSIDRDLGDHSQDNKDLLKNSSHNFKLEIMSFDIKKLPPQKNSWVVFGTGNAPSA